MIHRYLIYEYKENWKLTENEPVMEVAGICREYLDKYIIVFKDDRASYNVVWFPSGLVDIRGSRQHLATWVRSADQILTGFGMTEERKKPYLQILKFIETTFSIVDKEHFKIGVAMPDEKFEFHPETKPTEKEYKIVMVEWTDSQIGPQPWHQIGDQHNYCPKIISVGQVTEETDDHITLYGSVIYYKESDQSHAGASSITIPKGCIVSMTDLMGFNDWSTEMAMKEWDKAAEETIRTGVRLNKIIKKADSPAFEYQTGLDAVKWFDTTKPIFTKSGTFELILEKIDNKYFIWATGRGTGEKFFCIRFFDDDSRDYIIEKCSEVEESLTKCAINKMQKQPVQFVDTKGSMDHFIRFSEGAMQVTPPQKIDPTGAFQGSPNTSEVKFDPNSNLTPTGNENIFDAKKWANEHLIHYLIEDSPIISKAFKDFIGNRITANNYIYIIKKEMEKLK